jgi:hypothetical protein
LCTTPPRRRRHARSPPLYHRRLHMPHHAHFLTSAVPVPPLPPLASVTSFLHNAVQPW